MFDAVLGSQVRLSFDNRGLAISGAQMVHGWLYEVEVFNQAATVPEPSAWLLLGTGFVGLLATARLRRTQLT